MIFTTNVEKEDWGDCLGDPISTTAILERIYHHAVQVEIRDQATVSMKENFYSRDIRIKVKIKADSSLRLVLPDSS